MSHPVRFLMLCALLPLQAVAASTVTLVDISLSSDDNITAARDGLPRHIEQSLQLGIASSRTESLGEGVSLRLQARLDGRLHARHDGLNQLAGNADGQLLWRPGRSFYTPTIGLGLGLGVSHFQSRLRDAQESRFRLTLRQALTTRLATRSSLFTLWRGSESQVFDSHVQGGELALDWQATAPLSLTLAYQYRDGPVASIGNASPMASANARALQPDDVFNGLTAFSFDAQTHIGIAGAHYALNPTWSLDAQLRYLESDTRFDTRYHRWTLTTGLLARF